MMNPDSEGPAGKPGRSGSRGEGQSLLWFAAGAAWAVVAVGALVQARKSEARKRTRDISERLLHQVFPHGIRS